MNMPKDRQRAPVVWDRSADRPEQTWDGFHVVVVDLRPRVDELIDRHEVAGEVARQHLDGGRRFLPNRLETAAKV